MAKKGTKKIRYVQTTSRAYYFYDLDEDIFGKRKRLYGNSEEELKEKIEKAKKERELNLAYEKPKGSELSDYVRFYLKNAVGNIPSKRINEIMKLFQNAVYGSEIDCDMNDITVDTINSYYSKIRDKYPFESVETIDDTLRKTFALANQTGATEFDFEKVPKPVKPEKTSRRVVDYIMSVDELDKLLNFCLADNCQRYGINEIIVVIGIYTGVKLTSIRTLKAGAFDFIRQTMTVENDTIPVPKELLSWLQKQEKLGKISFDNSDRQLFLTRTNKIPQANNVQVTLAAIATKCGLPKGINQISLHKACVLRDLQKGSTPDELCKKFHYNSPREIVKIKEDYDVIQALF